MTIRSKLPALHPLLASVRAWLVVSALLFTTSGQAIAASIVAGYLENVWLGNGAIRMQAKLDTGANSSSVNAARSEEFTRDGRAWVRINLTNRLSQSYQLEAPVKKTVRIRRAGTRKERRLVVDLKICLGGYSAVTEFTLADRTGQSYQVLIGRKFLTDKVLVKSSDQFLLNNRC